MNPIDGQLQNAGLMQGQGQLEKLKRDYLNPSTVDQKKLKQAAQEFEAIFVQQLLEAMDKTVDRKDSFMGGGSTEEYWRGMLNQEVAKSISTRTGGSGFGLGEAIYRQMSSQSQNKSAPADSPDNGSAGAVNEVK